MNKCYRVPWRRGGCTSKRNKEDRPYISKILHAHRNEHASEVARLWIMILMFATSIFNNSTNGSFFFFLTLQWVQNSTFAFSQSFNGGVQLMLTNWWVAPLVVWWFARFSTQSDDCQFNTVIGLREARANGFGILLTVCINSFWISFTSKWIGSLLCWFLSETDRTFLSNKHLTAPQLPPRQA